MNILISSTVYWWNADAAYAGALAKLLSGHKEHNVHVLTKKNSLNEKKLKELLIPTLDGIDLFSRNPIKFVLNIIALVSFLKSNKIQVVNVHHSSTFLIFACINLFLKQFVLIRTRSTAQSVKSNVFNRALYLKFSDALIFPSQIVSNYFMKAFGKHKEHHIIYYPALQKEEKSNLIECYKKKWGLQKQDFLITIVARLSFIKGHHLLLESLRTLVKFYPNIKLLICYRDAKQDSDLYLTIVEQIKLKELEKHVVLQGPCEDILSIMKFSKVGIISSINSEMICRVAMEFFSVGTPIVAFDTGCLPEIINDGVNGVLVRKKDSESLLEGIRKVLDSQSLLDKLSKNALRDVDTRFSSKKFMRDTLDVFDRSYTQFLKEK